MMVMMMMVIDDHIRSHFGAIFLPALCINLEMTMNKQPPEPHMIPLPARLLAPTVHPDSPLDIGYEPPTVGGTYVAPGSSSMRSRDVPPRSFICFVCRSSSGRFAYDVPPGCASHSSPEPSNGDHDVIHDDDDDVVEDLTGNVHCPWSDYRDYVDHDNYG